MFNDINEKIAQANERHREIKSEIAKIMFRQASGSIDEDVYNEELNRLRKELSNVLFQISYLKEMMEGEEYGRHKIN